MSYADVGISGSNSSNASNALNDAFNVTGGGGSGKNQTSTSTLLIIGGTVLAGVVLVWFLFFKK